MGAPRREWPTGQTCKNCGEPLVPKPYYSQGRIKGYRQYPNFCGKKCANSAHNVPRNKLNARGWYIDKHGYVIINRVDGYAQPQHRAVMEEVLGRKLAEHETVHHMNGVRTDNRPENLELWSGRHGRGQRAHEHDIWSGMIPNYQFNAL